MPIYRIPLGFVFISEEQICSNHLGKKNVQSFEQSIYSRNDSILESL